jgi:Acetyltransferase (GNAT) family
MGIASSITRFSDYYARHGVRATVQRATVQLRRSLFARRMVVYQCDLHTQKLPIRMPESAHVDRVRSLAELTPEHLQELTSFWNPKQARHNIEERLSKGATLWLISSSGNLAGYGWTIKGRPIAPFYFPVGNDDVQLFDFYVFPKFRGRAMHWVLTTYILRTLAEENGGRAYADTGEWNEAQIAAFKMTPFKPLGMVRTFTIFGRRFTSWVDEVPTVAPQKRSVSTPKTLAAASSHEQR